LPAVLARGPNQSNAPGFNDSGGSVNGEGNFNSLSCTSLNFCLAVGGSGGGNGIAATSTTDGSSWGSSALPAGTPMLYASTCWDQDKCVAVGKGASVSTTNGGTSWTLSALPVAETTLLGVTCPSGQVCLASGMSSTGMGPNLGVVVDSSDGGKTWTRADTPRSTSAVGAVACPTTTTCIAVGDSLIVSNDSGRTWNYEGVSGGTQALRSISCSSSTTCVAVGANLGAQFNPTLSASAIITTNGGQTWTGASLPEGSGGVQYLSCISSNCVGAGTNVDRAGGGVIVTSSDGGLTWSAPTSVSGAVQVADVSCAAANHCVVTGRDAFGNPLLLQTTNGTSWKSSVEPPEPSLK
jgi:hypothetical protein